MDKLTSILAVIDPADETRHVIVKAMVLARHFRARLELFLCDSESAYVMRHAYDRSGVDAARRSCLANGARYLDAMKRSLAEDVTVTTHVACESPLYEAIVRRVREARPDIVIKSAAGHHPFQRFTLDANDWQLVRTCPVPLMLTRGRPWSAEARFAAALDVGDKGGTALARSILQTAGLFSDAYRGRLDLVYCDNDAPDSQAAGQHRDVLRRLVGKFPVEPGRQHIVQGDADAVLPEFAARQAYDMMFIGALTRRRSGSALVGTLTGRLVDALECDFVLVKSDSYVSPVAEPVGALCT